MMTSAYVVTAALTVLSLVAFLGDGHPYGALGVVLMVAFDLLVLLPDSALGGIKARAPHLTMAAATTLVIAIALLPPATPWFVVLFFVLSPTAMMSFPRQTGYAWVGVFSALTVVIFWVAGRGDLGMLLMTSLYIAGYFFFAAFATQTALANAAQTESQRLLGELQEAHARLQAYAAQTEALAVAEERNRMAREMHDTLGHRLTVAAVQLQAIERLVGADPGRAGQMAAAARDEVRAALAELRQTVAALRTPLAADLSLEPALRRLSADFEAATGVAVALSLPDPLPPIPPTHRLALYRGAQEGLTNIQKHANAQHAWLTLDTTGGRLTLRVADDGSGLYSDATPDAGNGFGLQSLHERASDLGGAVTSNPRPGGGFELTMTLPLPSEVTHG